MRKGQTIPPDGAYNAPVTPSCKCGSSASASSPERMRKPFTPLFLPRSYKACNAGISSSCRQTVSDPFLRKGKSSSCDNPSIISFPRTFSLAMREPSGASYPAWIMALFALDVPQHTSSHFSTTHTSTWYLDNSLAMAHPVTPAPIIHTSYIHDLPFFGFPAKADYASSLAQP